MPVATMRPMHIERVRDAPSPMGPDYPRTDEGAKAVVGMVHQAPPDASRTCNADAGAADEGRGRLPGLCPTRRAQHLRPVKALGANHAETTSRHMPEACVVAGPKIARYG